MRRRASYALAVFCLFVSFASVARGSDAPPAVAWQFPLSGVALSDVHSEPRSDYDPVNHQPGPVYFIDCANVTNTGEKSLSLIQLAFALIGADGGRIGSVLTYDATRARIPAKGLTRSICLEHGYAGGVSGQRLVGWVNGVAYTDGTRWSVAPTIEASASSPKSSGVRLSGSAIFLPDESCTDIQNVSGKGISRVQLMFEYVNSTGSVVRKDALDVRENLGEGQIRHRLCRSFIGITSPDVFYYAELLARGAANPATPKVFYKGDEVKLVVRVTTVDFSDGSIFHDESS